MMNMLLYTVIYCSTCLLSAEFWMLLQCKASGTKAPTIFSAHLHYQDEPGITRNISNISVFMRDCHHGTPRCSSSEVSSEVPTQTMQMNVYPINMTLESLSTSILGTWNGRWSHLFKFEISSGIYYPEVTIVQWLPTSAYICLHDRVAPGQCTGWNTAWHHFHPALSQCFPTSKESLQLAIALETSALPARTTLNDSEQFWC
jgi:hypothetical protein